MFAEVGPSVAVLVVQGRLGVVLAVQGNPVAAVAVLVVQERLEVAACLVAQVLQVACPIGHPSWVVVGEAHSLPLYGLLPVLVRG